MGRLRRVPAPMKLGSHSDLVASSKPRYHRLRYLKVSRQEIRKIL